MQAKWRKIIWAIMSVQLLFVHVMIFQSWYLSYYLNRIAYHFGFIRLSFINWNKVIICLWLGSACVVMLLYYLHYLHFRRTCIRGASMVSEPWILESMQKAIEETGLQKRRPAYFLYYNNGIREPFVIGFQKPILLLPKQEYDRTVLPFIFLHECCHIRHRDTLYKLFMLFMQSLMWFQPLMYLLRAVSFLDVEVACDESVVQGKDMEARKAYGMALLDFLQKKKTAKQAYSAYFYHGASQVRARIKAIMNENKRWDYLAVISIFILLVDVLYSGYRIGNNWMVSYQASQEEQLVFTYEGYEIPESFTQAAADSMLALQPVTEDAYYNYYRSLDDYEKLDYDDLPYEAKGPWQIRLKDADKFRDALNPLLIRYLYYYIDQEWATKWDPENNNLYISLDMVYQRLLAGDRENAVFAVVCKKLLGNREDLLAFPEPLADRAQFTYEQGAYYVYFDWTVQVRMVKDYVFELEGVADTGEILAAYQDKYPRVNLGDVPSLDLVYAVDRNQVDSIGQTAQGELKGEPWKVVTNSNSDLLQVSGADGILQEVPVPLSEVLTRGDQMDGQLTSLQAGSYQVDENKVIFAYGGSSSIPFSVVFYEEESKSFKKSIVVNNDYNGGRRIFIDFPENGQEGFLIVTGERVVYQEVTILFHTVDGGKSWQEVGLAEPDFMTQSHSLTTGAGFINNETGFLTIRDSETPNIWRTDDGGVTWVQQTLSYVPENYSMAYMPEEKDGVLTLYVGMEDYSEYGGTKAKYESTDDGITWEYRGFVLRK